MAAKMLKFKAQRLSMNVIEPQKSSLEIQNQTSSILKMVGPFKRLQLSPIPSSQNRLEPL